MCTWDEINTAKCICTIGISCVDLYRSKDCAAYRPGMCLLAIFDGLIWISDDPGSQPRSRRN